MRSLAWSPDGRYLLLDSGTSMAGQIAIVEVATGRTTHEQVAAGFAWSPDGQRLALGQLQPLEGPIPVECGDSVSLAVLEVGQWYVVEIALREARNREEGRAL